MIDNNIHSSLREKYNPDGSPLRNHQMKMLEMLQFIDKICTENNINYWLSSGTCLGAIRHGGFIPWDDDVDIEMMRKDYLKFLEVFKETDQYVLQSHKNDQYYFTAFCKVRDKNTSIYDSLYKYRGVFIDIFCLEYTNKTLAYILEKIKLPIAWHLYNYMKSLNRQSFRFKICSVLFKLSKSIYFFILPLFRFLTYFCWNNKLRHTYGVGWTKNIRYEKEIFPTRRVSFEGIMLPVPFHYDSYLRHIFGEYMTIPNENNIRPPHVQYYS